MRKKIIAITLATLAIGLFGQPVLAHEGSDDSATETRKTGRLDEVKRKVCDNRKTAIAKIVADAATAGQRHLNLFGNIAEKVEQFYVNKKLSATGYDAAVAAVNAKKAAAQQAVNDVKNISAIDCSGDNPVGVVDGIKTKITAMHKALRELQTSVKNLIVVVKTAAGGTH